MTMEQTPRWTLPLLVAGQAQKEYFHNEALVRIDALLHGRVESANGTVPPASPAIGQCWIVAAGASGAWAGQEGALACWSEGGWRFIAPRAGLSIAVADRGHALRHDGSAWRDEPVRAEGLFVDGKRVVRERQGAVPLPAGGATIDTESRMAIAAIVAALHTHGLIES